MKRILLGGLLLTAAALTAAPALKLSGRLGQSQPEKATPFAGSEASGVVVIPGTEKPAMLMGGVLYELNSDGSMKVLCKMHGGNPTSDGKSIYTFSSEFFCKYDCVNGQWKEVKHWKRLKKGEDSVTVARVGDKGFAEKGKFFTLNRQKREVSAYDENGLPKGVVLSLPVLPEKGGSYKAIALTAGSGDMLVSGYYPSTNLYRYKADGTQVKTNGWPLRGSWPTKMVPLKDGVIGCGQGSACFIPDVVANRKNVIYATDGNDCYSSGMVPDGEGGWYVSTTGGVKHYPADSLNECDHRIGGPGSVYTFSVNGSEIVASLGNLLYRMKLDDAEDSPFSSFGNEPWRVGGSWSGVCTKLAPNGTGFVVWDSKSGAFWQFEPNSPIGFGRSKWKKRTEVMKNVTALACENGKIYAADGGKFMGLVSVQSIAMKDGTAYVATPSDVSAIKAGKILWTRPVPGIKSLAILDGKYLAAADGRTIKLLTLAKGALQDTYVVCSASCIASSGKWLIAYDTKARAYFRYKLTE